MPKELAINRGYRLFTLTKRLFRSVMVFLDTIVNQVGSQLACSAGVFVLELAVVSSPPYWLEHKLITSKETRRNKSRKVREYVTATVVNECICSSTPKVKRSEKLRNV